VRTRERLLDAAERLWGDRGVEAVSLREIRIAAGQRNSSALQFHFGDRSGLLLALSQRHVPRIAALQQEQYAALVAAGRQDEVAALIEVLVGPSADYLQLGPSERAWIKILAQQATRPETALRDMVDHAPAVALHVGTTIHQRLSLSMDGDIVVERLISVGAACNHLCADRARYEDAPEAAGLRPSLPFARWRANLVDMAVGALLAPTSRPTGSSADPG
jgi:AcrR family transcriptional regulator